MDQKLTPLWDSIKAYIKEGNIPYHMPGHKQGRGVHPELINYLGRKIFSIDLTEIPGLDNLHCPVGPIALAQDLAAEAFGADKTFFLINGASAGIEALMMSFTPGDKIILPRNMHRSVLNGLILSGLQPEYIWPDYCPELAMQLPVTPDQARRSILDNPEAVAFFLLNPTYQGISGDIRSIVEAAGDMPILVDEAHGVHFSFHPSLPDSSLMHGAAACVHGAHKLIGALTQSAYLHLSGGRINADRIASALQILQTTSPSYILMASLDIARMQMATEGRALLDKTVEIALYIRKEINRIPGLYVPGEEEVRQKGDFRLDVTKININAAGLGLTGFQLQNLLENKYHIRPEMADFCNVLLFVTIGDNMEEARTLISALREISTGYRNNRDNPVTVFDYNLPRPKIEITPRAAWFSRKRSVPLEQAAGEICAEPVVPYPPGIPLIYPGEVISSDIIQLLKSYLQAGFCIQGPADPGLAAVKVIA